MNEEKNMNKYAGIDIGGTQLRLGIFDEEGNLLDVYKTDNDRTLGGERNIDRLLAYAAEHSDEIAAWGIASPGPLDLKHGKILNPPNLYGWDNFEIVKYITSKTGRPCTVNNDGNLAGLAEARMGAGKGYDSVVYLGMSTGMGGSFVYKGELITGAHCNTAEFYNVIVNDDPHHHGSANAGSLNETAGGAAMERIATEAYGRQMFAKDLFRQYDLGDPKASEILEKTSEALARGIANIYYIIDPDIYVIGGSIGLNNPWYIDKVFTKAGKYMTDPHIHTALSVFNDDAGLYGAMLAARDLCDEKHCLTQQSFI